MDVHVRVVRNELLAMALRLRVAVEALVEDTASEIEQEVKAGASARIARTVRTVRKNGGLRRDVIVGQRRRGFHAGLVEYGTQDLPAAPWVTPAGEQRRSGFVRAFRSLESELR